MSEYQNVMNAMLKVEPYPDLLSPEREEKIDRIFFGEVINRLSALCYGHNVKAGWWIDPLTGMSLIPGNGDADALTITAIELRESYFRMSSRQSFVSFTRKYPKLWRATGKASRTTNCRIGQLSNVS